MMALMQTDLPEPVVPATSRWGSLARSMAMGAPETSRPKPGGQRRFEFVKSRLIR